MNTTTTSARKRIDARYLVPAVLVRAGVASTVVHVADTSSDSEPMKRTVTDGDLNLANPKGFEELYRRIIGAARQVYEVFHLSFPGLLLIALTACGGGSNGQSAVPMPPQTSQSAPVPKNLESAPAPAEPFNIPSATMTTSSGGNSYTATYSETPNNGTTMFDGLEANSSTISLAITENGSPIVIEIETAYYLENPYRPLGLTLSSNGKQFDFLYNSTDPLPSTLTVGDSGPLGSGTYYTVNTNESVGSLTQTYSVASDDASTVELTTDATGTVNGQSISETIYYAVNASGAPQLDWFEILVNGTTLTFNNPAEWDY
jgi:hypothetical protein